MEISWNSQKIQMIFYLSCKYEVNRIKIRKMRTTYFLEVLIYRQCSIIPVHLWRACFGAKCIFSFFIENSVLTLKNRQTTIPN